MTMTTPRTSDLARTKLACVRRTKTLMLLKSFNKTNKTAMMRINDQKEPQFKMIAGSSPLLW